MLLLSIFHFFCLSSSSISLPYFNLSVHMRNCSGEHTWQSFRYIATPQCRELTCELVRESFQGHVKTVTLSKYVAEYENMRKYNSLLSQQVSGSSIRLVKPLIFFKIYRAISPHVASSLAIVFFNILRDISPPVSSSGTIVFFELRPHIPCLVPYSLVWHGNTF